MARAFPEPEIKDRQGLETTFLTIGTFRIAHHNFTWWTLQVFFIVFFFFWFGERKMRRRLSSWLGGLVFSESWGMWGGEVSRRMW